VQFVGDEVI